MMGVTSKVLIPTLVATGVVVFLISLLLLLLTCCRCALLKRIKKCKHKKKARNSVFVIRTKEDENQLISNVIYKSKLTRKDLQHETDSTASFPQLESDVSHTEAVETVEENNYESIEVGETEFSWRLDVGDIMTPARAGGERGVGREEARVEQDRKVGRGEVGGDRAGGELGDDDDDDNDDDDDDCDDDDDEEAGRNDDDEFKKMLHHQPLYNAEAPIETDVQYLSMDKPTRGIRKCSTFCGAPTQPYPCDDNENSESLLRLKNFGNISSLTRNSVSLASSRPVPIARCSPFRTSQNVEAGTDGISKHRHEDSRISMRKKRDSKAEVFPVPMMSLPREQMFVGDHQNERLSDSSDDLFKDAWWRSSDSLDMKGFHDGELNPPTVCRREPISRHAAPNSIYVKMEVDSPQLCRSPSTGQRARSATMPSILEGNRSSMLSDLSLWYPHLTSNVQFTAELMPALPKPCCSSPQYVNLRGTLPSRF